MGTANVRRGYAETRISAASGSPLDLTRPRRERRPDQRDRGCPGYHRRDPRCRLRSTSQTIRAPMPRTVATTKKTAPVILRWCRARGRPPERPGAQRPSLAFRRAWLRDGLSQAARDHACRSRACCGSRGRAEKPIDGHRFFPSAPSWRYGTGAVTATGEAVEYRQATRTARMANETSGSLPSDGGGAPPPC